MEKETKKGNSDITINNSVWKFFNGVPEGAAVIDSEDDPRNKRIKPPPLVYIDENGIHHYNKPASILANIEQHDCKDYRVPSEEDFNFLRDSTDYILEQYSKFWHISSEYGSFSLNEGETRHYASEFLPILNFKEYIGGQPPKETVRLTIVPTQDNRLFLDVTNTKLAKSVHFRWNPDNYEDFRDESEFKYLNFYNSNINNHSLESLENWHLGGFLCGGFQLFDRYKDDRTIDILRNGDCVSDYLQHNDNEKYGDYRVLAFYGGDGHIEGAQVLIYNPTEYENIPDSRKEEYIIDLISKQIEGTFTVTGKTKKTDLNYLKDEEFNQLIQEPDKYGNIVDWKPEWEYGKNNFAAHLAVSVYEEIWTSELVIENKDSRNDNDSEYLISEGMETMEEALNEGYKYYNKVIREMSYTKENYTKENQ